MKLMTAAAGAGMAGAKKRWMSDTIFALATAPGRAAVAVVRLSGPGTRRGAASAWRARLPRAAAGEPAPPAGRRRRRRSTRRWCSGCPGPAATPAKTAPNCTCTAGPAVVDARRPARCWRWACAWPSPGEFTRRAFENGKLDLAQAEGVADLIDAETEAQRRQALAQLGGALGRRYDALARRARSRPWPCSRRRSTFPTRSCPQDVADRARPLLEALIGELDAALADAERGERVREGYRIAIIGAPNAGKSSLLNALVGRDAAIVTATPGTTRDVIEVPLVLGGYQVLLADTAGLRETGDAIEAEGVRRARAWAESADLRLWVVDGCGRTAAWRVAADLVGPGDCCLLNKARPAAGRGPPRRPSGRGAALGLA